MTPTIDQWLSEHCDTIKELPELVRGTDGAEFNTLACTSLHLLDAALDENGPLLLTGDERARLECIKLELLYALSTDIDRLLAGAMEQNR